MARNAASRIVSKRRTLWNEGKTFPAETRWLRESGADAVGMSTVPEVIVANHASMKVLGLSLVSNLNDPDNFQPILLEDIIAEGRRAADRLAKLMLEFISRLED